MFQFTTVKNVRHPTLSSQVTSTRYWPGSRVAGWQRVHSYLAEGPACLIHRAMGWETCPMIHFFRTLPKTWWELANLPHATRGDPEDANSSAPDHLMDALRYWLLNVGGGNAEQWINWARQKAEAVVMVSLADWTAMEETLHLLTSVRNAERLREAIKQLDAGEGQEREPITP